MSAARRLRMLAAAAIAALALSACGGGGSAGRSGGGGSSNLDPSLTAGGVTASVSRSGSTTSIAFSPDWTTAPVRSPPAPSGWVSKARINAGRTETFRAITNIGSENDEDYLVYGYWAQYGSRTPTTPVKPFYWGKTAYAGNLGSLTGTATYTGGAAGAYTSTRSGEHSHGQFTANLSVTAEFDVGKVTGRMTGFRVVTWQGNPFRVDETIRWLGSIQGFRIRGEGPTGATWGGRFWGPSAGGALPTGVAGYFYKETLEIPSGGRAFLTGSFGATR